LFPSIPCLLRGTGRPGKGFAWRGRCIAITRIVPRGTNVRIGTGVDWSLQKIAATQVLRCCTTFEARPRRGTLRWCGLRICLTFLKQRRLPKRSTASLRYVVGPCKSNVRRDAETICKCRPIHSVDDVIRRRARRSDPCAPPSTPDRARQRAPLQTR